MADGPLSGFTIAITADRRAEEQAELIARRGGEVLVAPVIRTLALGDEQRLAEATAQLISRPPDLVVLSTAVGVRGWFGSAEGLGVADDLRRVFGEAEVLARGAKAAGAAVTAGVEVHWVTPHATYAEVVERLADREVRRPDGTPRRIALQLDGAAESALAAELADLGYDVVAVPVYEWHLPENLGPAERLVAAVAEGTVDAVTFTTAHAVTNFVEIAKRAGAPGSVIDPLARGEVAAVCVGPVTAARARSLGIARCVEPGVPRLGAMVQALAAAFAERRVELLVDGATLVLQGRLVSVDGAAPVRLTDRERAVLDALARRPGAVVSKRDLRQAIWDGGSDDHVVEVTVARLRRRLGAAGRSIETVVRRGYRLA